MAGTGAHIVLRREDAKQLFAQQGDAAIETFVKGLLTSKKHRDERLILEYGTCWDPIHRCLTDGNLDPGGGEFPINHCILGGKRIHQGGDFEAVLVRPDIVPFVAEELHHLKRSDFHAKYFAIDPADYGRPLSEQEFDKIWTTLQHIRQLFEDAAQDRAAILFAVDRRTT